MTELTNTTSTQIERLEARIDALQQKANFYVAQAEEADRDLSDD